MNLKKCKERQKLVLEKMKYYGYITQNQSLQAQNEKLKFASQRQDYPKYPYFIDFIDYLLRKTYGDDVVRRGGLRVYTTLNPKVQELAEKTIKEGIKAIPKASGVKQGALISVNVENGYIQALVGGVDFAKSNYNRAVYARRAPGSSFKPVVYLTGLRMGAITPESPIVDAPISFNTGWNIWSPHNWDGKYMGRMTIRKALTLSRNTPTVRIALKVGLDRIIETARLLGIKSPIDRNLSVVLGSAGISPLEMITVYSTLARNGVFIEPIAIRKIEDSQGNIIELNKPSPIQVVSRNFVKELNSILIDVVEKGTAKPAKLDDRQVAGKTGTTDSVKDIWFTGFTPDTSTTIWLGNDENQKLHGVFSSNCAELWKDFTQKYYKITNIAPRQFELPDKQIITAKKSKKIDKDKDKKPLNNDKTVSKSTNKIKNKSKISKNIELKPFSDEKIVKKLNNIEIKPKDKKVKNKINNEKVEKKPAINNPTPATDEENNKTP